MLLEVQDETHGVASYPLVQICPEVMYVMKFQYQRVVVAVARLIPQNHKIYSKQNQSIYAFPPQGTSRSPELCLKYYGLGRF